MRTHLKTQTVGSKRGVGKGFAFDSEQGAVPFADTAEFADRYHHFIDARNLIGMAKLLGDPLSARGHVFDQEGRYAAVATRG